MMETIVYKGFNITLCGKTLKAENPYFKIIGMWSEIKNRINQTVKSNLNN